MFCLVSKLWIAPTHPPNVWIGDWYRTCPPRLPNSGTVLVLGGCLEEIWCVIQKTGAGDGLISKQSVLGAKLTALLERPKNLGSFKPSQIFCCLATVEYKEDRKLPARQKLWTWVTKSLRGNRPAPAPYHYLVDEVDMYDISRLFKRSVHVLEQITICSLDDELEEIIKMDCTNRLNKTSSLI